MMKISIPRRGLVGRLGLAAVTALTLSAVSGGRADALSLINAAGAPAAKHASGGLTTEVRGHGGGGHGGGHGGFHGGGGFRGAAIHGGSFHGGRAFHGGPVFHGARFHHRGFAFRPHRFHHRHFYVRSYYADPYCRVIWTSYGPRRICNYRHWSHHHWRHHHRHYRFYG
jgi:hypothetical protein